MFSPGNLTKIAHHDKSNLSQYFIIERSFLSSLFKSDTQLEPHGRVLTVGTLVNRGELSGQIKRESSRADESGLGEAAYTLLSNPVHQYVTGFTEVLARGTDVISPQDS